MHSPKLSKASNTTSRRGERLMGKFCGAV